MTFCISFTCISLHCCLPFELTGTLQPRTRYKHPFGVFIVKVEMASGSSFLFLPTNAVFFYSIRCFQNIVALKRNKVVSPVQDCETGLIFPFFGGFFFTVRPGFVSKPTNQRVREGEEVTLNCSASGYPIPVITWIRNGQTEKKGATLSLIATKDNSGKYWCKVDNGLGPAIMAEALLDVQCK